MMMNFRKNIRYFTIAIFILGFVILQCEESLPLRIVPEDTLAITDISVVTNSDDFGYPFLNMTVIGVNAYEKTFQSKVDLSGYVHIWRASDPSVEYYLPVNNAKFRAPTKIVGRTLTVDPNDFFYIAIEWDLIFDDNTKLVDLLIFPTADPAALWIKSLPELFYIEAEMTLFSQTGLMKFEAKPFQLVAWKPNDSSGT